MSDSEKKGWFQRFRKKDKAPEAPAPLPEAEPAEQRPAETPVAIETPLPATEAPIAAPVPQPEPVSTPEPTSEPTSEPTAVPTPAPMPVVEETPVQSPEPTQEPESTVAETPAASPEQRPESVAEQEEEKSGWFTRLKKGLKKSTSAVSDGISGIFTKRKLDDETLEELEDLLITADLGISVAAKVTEALSKDRYNKEISDEEVKEVLASEIENILTPVAKPLTLTPANKPHVILMAGVNGAGKTTTIGKLGKKFKEEGKSVMLAAGDTFRAAAVEQLQVWGERVDVPVITKEIGSDAAALAYEAMERAIAENVDVLLIDTAGRLQNRDELMAELAKVVRVIGKKLDGAPHDTVIVLDATTGQNAMHQVEVFQKLANISGIVMTKLDGSARGGVLVACADKFGLPVHAIGVGEAIEDLHPFNPREFAQALVGLDD